MHSLRERVVKGADEIIRRCVSPWRPGTQGEKVPALCHATSESFPSLIQGSPDSRASQCTGAFPLLGSSPTWLVVFSCYDQKVNLSRESESNW